MDLDSFRRRIVNVLSSITVEPVMFLFMLGSFLQYSSLQQLLYYKVCMIEYNDTVICQNLSFYDTEESYVQKQTSHWLILINIALAFPTVVSSMFLGRWSDKVGRKMTMITPPVGAIINGLVLTFSSWFIYSPVAWLFLGTICLGLSGAYATLTFSVFSYLGDVTKKEARTMRYSILEAMTFLGSFLGLLTCGIVIDQLGFPAVFIYYIVCNICVIIYVLICIKDSVNLGRIKYLNNATASHDEISDQRSENDEEQSRTNVCQELLKLDNVKESLVVIGRKRPFEHRAQLIMLIICLFVLQLVGSGENDTFILYVKKDPLAWSATLISYYSAVKNLLISFVLLLCLPLLHASRIGYQDTVLIIIGVVMRMGAYTLLAFSRTTWMVFLVPLLASTSAVPAATSRSMMSKIVDQNEQGSLFAFMASLETLTVSLASAIFNALYPATLNILEGGFVFITMAILLIIPVILMCWIHELKTMEASYTKLIEGNTQASAFGDI
ncbi:solute carrier family 46 member 3-like isoform X2 [Anneissia japonica]|uniref:solute carrier family 46 member 3-like isoform X2 n=1 Tax=Anneissia japonica TaxID=1529436 RepID=UPI0014259104|nr:solute carrier family 46 member 3-like isoform X2 [Anneissia japonica]XP_033104952.1 solute carrier family 46 member 3-like isoform X2 [Anneissia japonica]